MGKEKMQRIHNGDLFSYTNPIICVKMDGARGNSVK